MHDLGEKVILYSQDCPGCEQLREHLVELGFAEKYRAIDVSSEEGQRIASDLGIVHVPNCLVVEETPKGLRARACTETEFSELIEGK